MPHLTDENVLKKTDELISLMMREHATIALANNFDRGLVEIIGTVISPEVCYRFAHVMLTALDQQAKINSLEAELTQLRIKLDALTN